MSANRRTARALAAGTVTAAAIGVYASALTTLWLCIPTVYCAAVLGWCSNRHYAAHRRAVAEAEWEHRHVLGQAPAPLNPCCALGDYSGGAAHDRRKCTDLFHRITADLAAERPIRSSQ